VGITRKTVALLGASGLVGGFCLRAALADQAIGRVVLFSRRELSVAFDPRLSQRTLSLDKLERKDFDGIEDIFCALGTTIRKAGSQAAFRRVDLEYPLAAAQAAAQAGARQFLLVSSVGADPSSRSFYLRTKGELEQELDKLGFGALHIFRPSLLLGRREEFRLGERVMIPLAPALNLFMMGGLKRYRAISAARVGKAMVAAAKRGGQGVLIYHYDQIVALASDPSDLP
jgi:uncharacterized protein YbjT (DUF2867 family)